MIRVSWYYKTESLGRYVDDNYFDDAYYIVEYGSADCRPISRDELLDKMGGYYLEYVYRDEYDEYGIVRDMYLPMP